MKRIKVKDKNIAEDVKALFRRYLDICNEAIEKHKSELPYKTILSATDMFIDNRPIDLAVYDDEPKAAFSLYFKNKKLTGDAHLKDTKKAWRMNLSHLREVVKNPEKYIKHPEKLDLDWLKSRLGIL